MNWYQINIRRNQAVAEVVPSSSSVQIKFRFSLVKIDRSKSGSTDQKLDQPVTSKIKKAKVLKKIVRLLKSYVNRSKFISTDQKLDRQIKSWISISKVRSTPQNLDQQIKSWINMLEVWWTDQKSDKQLKSWIKRTKVVSIDQ